MWDPLAIFFEIVLVDDCLFVSFDCLPIHLVLQVQNHAMAKDKLTWCGIEGRVN